MQPASTPPFACTYSDDLPAILAELRCSLAMSTFQSGKVIFVSNNGDDGIRQLPRAFDVPMGIAVRGDELAVATRDQIVLLRNDPRLARQYPRQPDTYDALYVPRSVYFSNVLDVHDLVWTSAGLTAVNTAFSCLSVVDEKFSFKPIWQPRFISELRPEDRCHLNGVATSDGVARYVSALGTGNEAESWRADRLKGGVVIDVESHAILAQGLSLPHSPRMVNGELFVLNSAACQLLRIDPATGHRDIVTQLPGFARGMAHAGDYLFIGLSQLREGHQSFGDLAIARRKDTYCGLVVVHVPTGAITAELRYLRSCKEIFDVQVLPEMQTPGLLGLGNEAYRMALSAPDFAAWTSAQNTDG